MTDGKRDYKKENKLFNSRPEEKKKRAARNAARAQLMKEGKVKKGDGKDVDHKVPLSKGGSKARSNLRVQSASNNRSFARTKTSKVK